LPSSPDIVLPKYKSVIFVHGCFWHVHQGCKDSTIPKTNTAEWGKKLTANSKRDKKKINYLKKAGWKVLVIWECQVREKSLIEKKNLKFLKK
jgi:DNA mismatch endonuclease (patch repair protein)